MPAVLTSLVGLSELFEFDGVEGYHPLVLRVRFVGAPICPHCEGTDLRDKGRYLRTVRHVNIGQKPCFLHVEAKRYFCHACKSGFRQPLPGILRYKHSTEAFRRQIAYWHQEGISQKSIRTQEGLGTATVERIFHESLDRKARERLDASCPRILGIDEHHFTKEKGYATTFCDLAKHKIFDVVLGRSEKALEPYFNRLLGKNDVRVVCMDLSPTYRAIVQKHLPNALIVADRFHVIRLVNQHFLDAWKILDPKGRADRGLLSLMRRHATNLKAEQRPRLLAYLEKIPGLLAIYQFKQRLCRLLSFKSRTKRQCRRLIPHLLLAIHQLRTSGFAPLLTLGETLSAWKDEIARMWRFTKNNGITEGFHTKMEMISRRAFGFRNFENYRLRVKILCG